MMMNPPPTPGLRKDTSTSTGTTDSSGNNDNDDTRCGVGSASFSPKSAASTPGTVLSRTSASPSLKTPGGRSSGSRDSNGTSKRRIHRHSTSSYDSFPDSRVLFGHGTINKLPAELGRLRLSSPLIVSSPSRIALARRIQSLIPNLKSRILDSSVVNVPTKVVDDAVARITGHDAVISIGAGQAIGLAKAISIRKMIPHVCIPTTYSGSEMSPLMAADGGKLGHKGSKVVPTVILYDEDLTGSVAPKRFAAPSGNVPLPTATTKVDCSGKHSGTDDDAQWSYIHLPGV